MPTPTARDQQTPDGDQKVILVHPLAPSHPGIGQACNGCGLCCLWQPCPVGMVVTGRVRGACRALVWSDSQGAYRCGLLQTPERFVHWLPADLVRRLARRWIAAGVGCDAPLRPLKEPDAPPS